MTRLQLFAFALLALAACQVSSPDHGARGWVSVAASRPALGTLVSVETWCRPGQVNDARAAQRAALARVDALERVLSDYAPSSELSVFCSQAGQCPGVWIAISDDLGQALEEALVFARSTDGAFDPTVGALTRLLRRALRQRELPPAQAWQAARSTVGARGLEVDRHGVHGGYRARLFEAGTRLDLGGFGKGWIADRALDVLVERGFARSLLALGGDVRAGDAPPGRPGWRVVCEGLDPARPFELELERAAVSTSGDRFQFVEFDGRRLSHLVDPRSGEILTGPRAAGCLAPDGARADALGTAAAVLGAPGVELLSRRFPHCSLWFEARVGPFDAERVERTASGRFVHNGGPAARSHAPTALGSPAWNAP